MQTVAVVRPEVEQHEELKDAGIIVDQMSKGDAEIILVQRAVWVSEVSCSEHVMMQKVSRVHQFKVGLAIFGPPDYLGRR